MKRFWDKCQNGQEPTDHIRCWEWSGARSKKGYGRFNLRAKNIHAHRLAYELVYGPIPEGRWVLHRCDNPPCCNPSHLFLGDNETNVRDMIAKGRHRPAIGEKNGRALITADQAAAIRKSGLPSKMLAAEYGIGPGSIRNIRSGRSWR